MHSEPSCPEMEKSTVANGFTSVPEEKHDELKQNSLPRKVYVMRNSVLTDLMEVNHLQTVFNISVSVCILLLINAVIYYSADPQMLPQDIGVMIWGASKLQLFANIWLSFNFYALFIYQGFRLWIYLRNTIHAKLADSIFLLLYVASIVVFFTATAYMSRKHDFPPITGFALVAEQVRIFMKVYSFVRENVPRAVRYNPKKDGNPDFKPHPSLTHFIYFLFIPALIYRDSYPKKKDISWKFVFNNLFKFISCIFIAYCVFTRFNVDIFKNIGIIQFTLPQAALTFAGAIVIGSMILFLIFYGILHCWLNIFAEVLYFGDREFYQDWWNSTSFSQYYRKWNTVVYDWLYAYVYSDTHRLGCSRSVSLVLVFIVSAIVHEYIISLSLGFFYPALLVVYSTLGVFFVFLTKKRTAQLWNTFMWTMLFFGWGLLVSLYTAEWYARANCPSTVEDPILDFFMPRSWNQKCVILKYS
ncbi:sterol O-acyltransferase 1-like [Stegodyphus dumicola]|uniref:sterol O-acyltransferase 1-like n=1 Tax=Stegodyphus dumicola TaxID=202533 RepID=UPI0015B22068|nr:sterol O-acyltransferase 1-like [Stegodyphus dumicola]XP_035232110.1 sterol O-acyltransferase 1-like [Stegodyphus dumicola]XP_035232111.1 sterol O-acyltransferase 1-like [Stegodyphus dumicola]